MGAQPLRFEKELMRDLVRELYDLVFDRWTIARAGRLDLTAVHRRAMDVLGDDASRLRCSVSDIARHLHLRDRAGSETHGRGITIARLDLELRPINRPSVQPWRGAGLQSSSAQAERFQRFAEHDGWRLATASRRKLLLAAVDESV